MSHHQLYFKLFKSFYESFYELSSVIFFHSINTLEKGYYIYININNKINVISILSILITIMNYLKILNYFKL